MYGLPMPSGGYQSYSNYTGPKRPQASSPSYQYGQQTPFLNQRGGYSPDTQLAVNPMQSGGYPSFANYTGPKQQQSQSPAYQYGRNTPQLNSQFGSPIVTASVPPSPQLPGGGSSLYNAVTGGTAGNGGQLITPRHNSGYSEMPEEYWKNPNYKPMAAPSDPNAPAAGQSGAVGAAYYGQNGIRTRNADGSYTGYSDVLRNADMPGGPIQDAPLTLSSGGSNPLTFTNGIANRGYDPYELRQLVQSTQQQNTGITQPTGMGAVSPAFLRAQQRNQRNPFNPMTMGAIV